MADRAELSIKGESIQSLYGMYLKEVFLVNRRYQRKLVWTVDEKRSFIDSIINGYPVPLILLADVATDKGRKLEIIDGMQRMNAIMSFIDQEFDVNGKYFNLETMADTKLLMDNATMSQKGDPLERELCYEIVRYNMPLSIFQGSGNSHIDEVFRRLNSGGRHLSKQELRQAGTISKFASIVRKLSTNIRGDSSPSDILDLKSMKKISITNRSLSYGVAVEDIFWVKHSIITKEALRQSQDEEVIADIVAWISLDKKLRSSSEILNQLYGYGVVEDEESAVASTIEIQIQKANEESVIFNVQSVFDELIKLVDSSGKTFNALLFRNQQPKISRYFQIVFYAFYKLLIDENLEIVDKNKLLDLLDGAGDKTITLASGGGNWSAKEKQTQCDAFSGVIRSCFAQKTTTDPPRNHWVTRFENILMQSSTEQTLYDFKVGIHDLVEKDSGDGTDAFSKVIKTLTAMANTHPGSIGYCILGVADKKPTATRHEEIFKEVSIPYSSFHVTGIHGEAAKYHGDIDKYFTKLVQLIKSEPISDRDKDYLSRNIISVKYFNKDVIVLKIESDAQPSVYDRKYFVRHGSNIDEIKPENFGELFSRFK